MTTALDATALADLLDDLMAWLKANPGKDLDDFADDNNCSVEDISDAWNTYFSADFSRDYKIDNDYDGGYHPSPPPHGDPQALKSYIVHEVNTYQEYTTINNIEDNSFNQQIIAGGDVDQDIDIDNSDNTADDGGVLIRDSDVDDSNIVTGDRNVVDSEDAITGDVTTNADDNGQAATNIGFGDGDVKNAQVAVENEGNNTTGDTGSADGEGGDGGSARANSDADGGDGGSGGDIEDPFLGVGVGGDGGDGGGAGSSAGSSADGGSGTGGDSGDSGDAGNDTDVTIMQ